MNFWLDSMSDEQLRQIREECRDLELRMLWLMENGVCKDDWRRKRVLIRLGKILSSDPREKVLREIKKDVLWLMDQINDFEESC